MGKIQILIGDVRARLADLPDKSVQCVVTSPPYWGLRDYGVEGQLGLEKTPEEYVANMVSVFREVRRVLRDDGTVFLNMGDCYYTQPAGNKTASGFQQKSQAGQKGALAQFGARKASLPKHKTLKPKDLVGMPWMLAFALRADGWYLRSDIIWAKPNPMPESVRDRPTKAHEYMFLLTKKGRYYYDQEAVREEQSTPIDTKAHQRFGAPGGKAEHVYGHKVSGDKWVPSGKRNLRSVWTIPTQPFPDAHFATFPEALVVPCVKAGTSEKGCCPECGAGWVRVVERTNDPDSSAKGSRFDKGKTGARDGGERTQPGERTLKQTTGWKPSCTCPHPEHGDVREFTDQKIGERGSITYLDDPPTVPCTVLDPFLGSGTTALVSARLGRDCIGVELSPEYVEIAQKRLDAVALMVQVEVK